MTRSEVPRPRPRSRVLRRLVLVFLVLLPLFAASVASGAVVPLDAEAMVRQSADVVVARVVAKNPRWNDRHNLIVTDYEIVIDQRLKGEAPRRLTITVLGGTLDGETHQTSVSTPLEVGKRYVLFLRDDPRTAQSPFTGAWQGVVGEIVDETGTSRPAGGGITKIGGEAMTFDDFVAKLQRYVEEVESTPETPDLSDESGLSDVPALPAKTWAPGAAVFSSDLVSPPFAEPADAPPDPGMAAFSALLANVETREVSPPLATKYHIARAPALPVVFNEFPLDWYWSPHDQYMMSKWNVYKSHLFHVYVVPSGTWAWGNGIFDLAGWPSNADMIAQFGSGWDPGVLGITYYRWITGPIVEADIALNPAYSWTLNNEFALRDDNSVWGFEQTMLHELGHSFGLHHPWETQNVWWDSVMNYSPKDCRHPMVHTDDANGVRAAYPGTAIHDGLVSFYQTHDSTVSSSPIYDEGNLSTFSVLRGGTFSIYDLMLENLGTNGLVNPTIEIYLTPNRMDWTGSLYLDSVTFYQTIGTFTTLYFDVFSIDVPVSTPPGTYYVGVFYRDAADTYLPNNSAWPEHGVQLVVQPLTTVIFSDGFESGFSAWAAKFP